MAAAAVWTLHLLNLTLYPMARCLDGSPGGYYTAPLQGAASGLSTAEGAGAGAPSGLSAAATPDRFILHLQGGGWCLNYDDCAARAGTHYGSSAGWTRAGACPDPSNPACWGDSPSGSPAGLRSLDASQSPLFYSAQHVFLAYCDGASFSGALTAPHAYNASLALHFRGRYILQAVLEDLQATLRIGRAREVLLKGCSAGGMAAVLHADAVGAQLAAWAAAAGAALRYAAAPGAGLFLDQAAFNSSQSFSSLLLWGLRAQNASGSLGAACLRAHAAAGDGELCYLAPHALPHVATPLFLANSLTDSCALTYLMELGCDARVPGNCSSSQLAYVAQYRANMLGVVAPVLAAGRGRHGAYLQACWTHIVEDDEVSWGSTVVAGQRQVDTFAAWWLGGGGGGGGAAAAVAIDGEWGSNPTCSNLGGCD